MADAMIQCSCGNGGDCTTAIPKERWQKYCAVRSHHGSDFTEHPLRPLDDDVWANTWVCIP